jgi:hypothetical protein
MKHAALVPIAVLAAFISPHADAADCGWSDWAAADPIKCPYVLIQKKCHLDSLYAQMRFQNTNPRAVKIVWQGTKGGLQVAQLGPGLFTGPTIEAEAWVSCNCGQTGWFTVNILSATLQ